MVKYKYHIIKFGGEIMYSLFVKIFSILLSVFSLLALRVGNPTFPNKYKTVDMSKFTETFSDEFDDELDRSVWGGHYTYGNASSVRNGSYWNNSLAGTENGNLVIKLRYLEDGIGGTGAGWYTAGLDTSGGDTGGGGFSQKFGYFETRCILPKGADIWSAFWLMNDQVFNVDGSGRDGTEVDIMESAFYGRRNRNNVVYCNLHYDGYGDAHKVMQVARVYVNGNPYEEFNTYSVEWNEKEYIFYVNGMEYARSSFGGVCQNPLYLILSVEMSGDEGVPSGRANTANPDLETEFTVDYVRVYQYNDLL